jgi:hypothetical protein
MSNHTTNIAGLLEGRTYELDTYKGIQIGGVGRGVVGILTLRATTTGVAPVAITSLGTATSSTGVSIPLAVDSSISFEGTVVAREQYSATNGQQSMAWNIKGSAARGSATTQIIASQVTQIAYGSNSNYALKIGAGKDSNNFGVTIQASGEANKNILWNASINYSSANY